MVRSYHLSFGTFTGHRTLCVPTMVPALWAGLVDESTIFVGKTRPGTHVYVAEPVPTHGRVVGNDLFDLFLCLDRHFTHRP